MQYLRSIQCPLPPLLDSPGTPLLAKGPVERESAREQGSTPRARPTQSLPSHAVSTRGWTNPHPAPTPRIARVCATHRPRVRQPARPHRPTSPPTTQGPLEAWCFPRPAAAGPQCSSPVSGAPLLVSHRRMARADARHRSASRTVHDSPVEKHWPRG